MTTITTATDSELILHLGGLQAELKAIKQDIDRTEYELQQRMEQRGATAIANDFYDVRLETTYILSVEELRARVGELVPADEWDKAVTPEHEQTIVIAAKADARVVNSWRKFGSSVAAGIDAAKIPDKVRLIVKEKK